MASNPVKVLVVVPERRDTEEKLVGVGYWAGGRCWPYGRTTAVIEDDPDKTEERYDAAKGVMVPVIIPGLKVEQKLRQLKEAQGGEVLVASEDKEGKPRKSPAMLAFEIIEELKPQAPAQVAKR